MKYKDMTFDEKACYILVLCFAVFLVSVAVISGIRNRNLKVKEQTYTMYLDGVQVSSNTVCADLYDYKIDDAKKVIYLTHTAWR